MFQKIKKIDKILFAKHLSTMIKAGLPLKESVLTLKEQTKSKNFKKILDEIAISLDNGRHLGESLAKYPREFDRLFINIIKVGEASGTLEENLEYLSEQLEKNYDLQKKVKGAMLYPIFVVGSTLTLGVALAIFILPKLLPLFNSFDIELPLPTKVLIWFTETLQNHGLLILLGLFILVVLLILLMRIRGVRKFFHIILLRTPLFGRISRNKNLAQYSRTLHVLLKSGIPVVRALEITSKTLKNIVYQEAIEESSRNVQRGEKISSFLIEKEFLFPLTISRMIQVGEKTGRLENTLFHMAKFYEKEVDNTTKNLSTVLEPFLLVIIGLVVGFIAIAIILPIYRLTGGLA